MLNTHTVFMKFICLKRTKKPAMTYQAYIIYFDNLKSWIHCFKLKCEGLDFIENFSCKDVFINSSRVKNEINVCLNSRPFLNPSRIKNIYLFCSEYGISGNSLFLILRSTTSIRATGLNSVLLKKYKILKSKNGLYQRENCPSLDVPLNRSAKSLRITK